MWGVGRCCNEKGGDLSRRCEAGPARDDIRLTTTDQFGRRLQRPMNLHDIIRTSDVSDEPTTLLRHLPPLQTRYQSHRRCLMTVYYAV